MQSFLIIKQFFYAQNHAIRELIVKNLFQRNGYNAAYTKEALGEGIFAQNKLVDALVGGKQSQLVVFDPKDIQILDKTFKIGAPAVP